MARRTKPAETRKTSGCPRRSPREGRSPSRIGSPRTCRRGLRRGPRQPSRRTRGSCSRCFPRLISVVLIPAASAPVLRRDRRSSRRPCWGARTSPSRRRPRSSGRASCQKVTAGGSWLSIKRPTAGRDEAEQWLPRAAPSCPRGTHPAARRARSSLCSGAGTTPPGRGRGSCSALAGRRRARAGRSPWPGS